MAGVKGRSGGARLGAGRPRRDQKAAWLAGAKTGPRAVTRPHEASEPADTPQPAVSRPQGLSLEDAAVWDELAPLALEQKTLALATAMAFADLCGYIVLERKLRAAPLAVAGPDHRGMIARVDAGRARFRLVPDGKPVVTAAAPVDEWAEFDGPRLVEKGA